MSAGWVAAQVRSRSLASHCVGPAGAREIANSGSLERALDVLSASSYGERLSPRMDLATSEHAVFESVLWNLRVLAGWSPALGASRLRVLAGCFELVNLQSELARIAGHTAMTPYNLGSLASISRYSPLSSNEELRDALRHSAWGDPGSQESADINIALQFSLARRIVEGVPEAGTWAETYAALTLARLVAQNIIVEPSSVSGAHIRSILGLTVLGARTLRDLTRALPADVAAALKNATTLQDLWLCEARWWTNLWDDALERVRQGSAGPATVVAAIAVQAADAWRIRMALEIAARCGRGLEILDAVA